MYSSKAQHDHVWKLKTGITAQNVKKSEFKISIKISSKFENK